MTLTSPRHDRIGHSDRPLRLIEDDSLGLRSYAEALAEFIQHCDTPFTVAVQGDWGTGKTSLMNMVEAQLTAAAGDKPVQTVWFQTWQYSQFGSLSALPVSLLATLLDKIAGERGTIDKAKGVLTRLAKPVANAVLRAGTAGFSELSDFDGVLARQTIDSAADADMLKSEIAALIAQKLKAFSRIVVFVDDLDRIKPAIAVEILETLKLFVDFPGCVFVLALDYGVVSQGLNEKFGISERDLGRSFFDKIIQLPFAVPVSHYTMGSYIKALFKEMHLPMSEGDDELFERLIRSSVSVNPRGIKRVFNSLQLLIAIAHAREDRLKIRILFATLCLQIGYEQVYNWLLGKGVNLSEADLLSVLPDNRERRDLGLAEAITKIADEGSAGDERRGEYDTFAAVFFEAIQHPDTLDDRIDDAELRQIGEVLSLSRVTSVQKGQTQDSDAGDSAFRRRNQKMMEEQLEAMRKQWIDDFQLPGRNAWPNSGRDGGKAIQGYIDANKELKLSLSHGASGFAIDVEANPKAIRRRKNAVARVMAGIGSSELEASSEGMMSFYRRPIDAAVTLEERRLILQNDVIPLYMRMLQALRTRLWQ